MRNLESRGEILVAVVFVGLMKGMGFPKVNHPPLLGMVVAVT